MVKGYYLAPGTRQVVLDKTAKNQPVDKLELPTELVKCVKSKTKKDQMHWLEIIAIAGAYFPDLEGPPTANKLNFKHGNDYDPFIRGWCKYWNDIFTPKELLDPNLVKALIASESSFDEKTPNKVGAKSIQARGLMQVTEKTRKILGDPEGELKDHLLVIPQDKILNPIINICAGTRWLFRKKEILETRPKKKISWELVFFFYKGEPTSKNIMETFYEHYGNLKK